MELEGRILSSEITQVVRQRVGYSLEGSAGLVSYLNTANEADIAVVFDERPDGTVGVSIRAVPGFDVSQVAVSLGGGGHAQAAGPSRGTARAPRNPAMGASASRHPSRAGVMHRETAGAIRHPQPPPP